MQRCLARFARVKSATPFLPPMRDGVSASCVHVPETHHKKLLDFLSDQFKDISRDVWVSRFTRGLILNNSGNPLAENTACKIGERIYYYRELAAETPIPFSEYILFQDEHILVADKPHFLPVIPSGRFLQETLLVRLKKCLGIEHLTPVHRIDKDTAGLVIFSLNPRTRDAYQALFRQRRIEKTYEALAPVLHDTSFPVIHHSKLVEDALFFRTQEIAGAPNSKTHIALINTYDKIAHYRLQPVTGRKHQLRVNMAALGCPIINDCLYPDVKDIADDDFSAPLQLLAKSLRFTDPITGEPRHFTSSRTLHIPN